MKNLLDPESKLISTLNIVADFVFVNILFLICCIPIVTIGAARAAMCTVAAAWAEKESCGGGTFLRAFRDNFKVSLGPWLIMLGAGLFLALDAWFLFLYEIPGEIVWHVIVFLLSAVYLLILPQLFHVLARYTCTGITCLKNAALIALGNMVPSAVCAFVGAVPFLFMYYFTGLFLDLLLLWGLGYFSLAAYWEAGLMKKTYKRLSAQLTEEPESPETSESPAET